MFFKSTESAGMPRGQEKEQPETCLDIAERRAPQVCAAFPHRWVLFLTSRKEERSGSGMIRVLRPHSANHPSGPQGSHPIGSPPPLLLNKDPKESVAMSCDDSAETAQLLTKLQQCLLPQQGTKARSSRRSWSVAISY